MDDSCKRGSNTKAVEVEEVDQDDDIFGNSNAEIEHVK